MLTVPELKEELAPIKTDIAVLKWMSGASLALVLMCLLLLIKA